MAFFHHAAKAAPKPRSKRVDIRDIPVTSLREMGCNACPRAKEAAPDVTKMEATGAKSPVVYILFAAPSTSDGIPDLENRARNRIFRAVLDRVPRGWGNKVRVNTLVQCATDGAGYVTPDAISLNCCHNRVVRDIEDAQPDVIIGVGDLVLNWVTNGSLTQAPNVRGRFINARVGRHECLYFPINAPMWALSDKNKYGPGVHEVVTKFDLDMVFHAIDRRKYPPLPRAVSSGYTDGIEHVYGSESGDLKRVERFMADYAGAPSTAVDIETNGLRPPYIKDPKIWCAAIGTFEHTLVFPLDHPLCWSSDRSRRQAWGLLGEWLLYSNKKAAHNLSFEMEWFAFFYGLELLWRTEWDDTMSMAHSIDNRRGTKSLDAVAAMLYAFNLKALSNLDVTQFTTYPLPKAWTYCGLDTKWCHQLSRDLPLLLDETPALREYHELKLELAPSLVSMELKGLPVDEEEAATIEKDLKAKILRVEVALARTPEVQRYERKFGVKFNPAAPADVLKLMEAVCNRDEVVTVDRDGTETRSTDEETLLSIPAAEVPSAPLILEHRGMSKLLSTYVAPVMSGKIVGDDGALHPKYSSMVALTSRLAGEDPNPMNWPKRKHREIRRIVKPRRLPRQPRRKMMACDYGQIEFRVAGMASEDDNLVKYCWTGYDVHKYWAQRMVDEYPDIIDIIVADFGVDWDAVGLKTLRQEAKNKWVFPMIFGSLAESCARNLKLPESIAKSLAREFWDEFPGVKKWQTRQLKFYEKHLYVETLMGVRRYGPMTPNEIINMPIQGTAAHIVQKAQAALAQLSQELYWEDIDPRLNVHDDLTFIPTEDGIEETYTFVAREMCRHRFDWIITPLVVEVSVGDNWESMHEVAKFRSDEMFNIHNPYK